MGEGAAGQIRPEALNGITGPLLLVPFRPTAADSTTSTHATLLREVEKRISVFNVGVPVRESLSFQSCNQLLVFRPWPCDMSSTWHDGPVIISAD